MVQINWRGGFLNVTRVVLCQQTPKSLADTFRQLADQHGLRVAGAESQPQEGDLWVGTGPRAGWGDASPRDTGWAPGNEAYLVLAQLRRLCVSAGSRED